MAPIILELPVSSSRSRPATAVLHPTSDQALLSTLSSSAHLFLQPAPALHTASLVLAKRYLDPLAKTTSETQEQRQRSVRKKRKRGDIDDINTRAQLRAKEIHLEGFGIEQIWQQARRVLDASRVEVEKLLPAILQDEAKNASRAPDINSHSENGPTVRFKEFNEDGFEVDFSDDQRVGDDDDSMGEEDGLLEDGDDAGIAFTDNEDDVDPALNAEGLNEDMFDGQSDSDEQSKDIFVPDKNGLNDGFFSIDDFNRQSEFLEHQDGRVENDGAASDEEDIDWDADPMVSTAQSRPNQAFDNDEVEESEDEADGPTFGNADLNAPNISDSDDASGIGAQMEDAESMNNTNNIKYSDFFAPPPQKASKSNRRRALPKTQPPKPDGRPEETNDQDIQRTIAAVRRDIFEDDLSPNEDSTLSDPEGPQSHRSSHQKRQAKLAEEIRLLEAAAVAKRDWTLSGEARAAQRPINSLLEEDLEFERAGKPIPVITHEVSEDIEALIKRRILAKDFDEVIRRRPGNLATGGKDVRRGRFELEDSKPQQGLAEMYEAEHLKQVDPEGYVDKRDEKLKQEHAKIEQMWKDVSAKLDALSSWHYRPKPPTASINVVADVPTISMEDARPAAGGEVGGESMLAPQEIYKAGEARDKKIEVVKKRSGLPVGREEMTRDEKIRRRRREKERIRKAGGLVAPRDGQGLSKRTKEKKSVIGDLKKGGVRVIGKKGEIRDVEGKAVKGNTGAVKGAGGYKL